MEFQSFDFVFGLLPLTILAYVLARTRQIANIVFLVVSIVFYGFYTYWFIFPMFISAMLDYRISLMLDKEERQRKRKMLLFVSIFVNLGLLAFFKYTTWLTTAFAGYAGPYFLQNFGIELQPVFVPLPAGISFYTFQTMAYTIDVYRRDIKAEKDFVTYNTFVSFFPQLVAGPIERAGDLLEQLKKPWSLPKAENINKFFIYFLFGLTIKLVVADNCGNIITLMENWRLLTPQDNIGFSPYSGWLYAYAFAFQIYGDFYAYTLMARGCAVLFDIHLQRNFNMPYFAVSPSDFWRRWHISLSSWFRDYVYIPLGGNRGNMVMYLRNLFITMFLTGLWHGAGIFFIVWGLYHGALIAIYRLTGLDKVVNRNMFVRAAAMLVMFHLVCIGWVFFRADIRYVGTVFASMFDFGFYWLLDPSDRYFNDNARWAYYMSIYILPLLALELWGNWKREEFVDLISRQRFYIQVPLALCAFYAIVFFGARQAEEFIYFRF